MGVCLCVCVCINYLWTITSFKKRLSIFFSTPSIKIGIFRNFLNYSQLLFTKSYDKLGSLALLKWCTLMDLPHMDVQKQDDQHEHTFSNYVRIQDVVLKTCLRRWTIGKSGERGSGISVLPARHDDDDEAISLGEEKFWIQTDFSPLKNWPWVPFCSG